MRNTPHDHPLHRWFAGLVEESFQERVGIASVGLLDYLTDLLTDFIHVERINLLVDGSGRRIEDVADMLTATELSEHATPDIRKREYHRHIGDFTLFWTGVYPENLRRIHRRQAKDDLIDYFDQGKRSYLIASNLSAAGLDPPGEVLAELSDKFEYCVYGLGLVRQRWESGESESGPGELFSN
ncbi:MAG TPA: hypothetical protein P5081_09915 [Phycisphaerae bacterium]|nr:hypothetical protein [Phycisphaerae bacterium]HRW53193.1 hypothetical protein [Phycisphaerae bacterium]